MELNLGQFNQCMTRMSSASIAELTMTSNEASVFYYTHHHSEIFSRKVDDLFHVPTFNVAAYEKEGDFRDPKTLLAQIELEILEMIRRIILEIGGHFKFEDILIPIRSIEVHDDYQRDGYYGWIDIGIAVVVPVTKGEHNVSSLA